MRIGIDTCCWSNPRGFGRYTRELVTSLVKEYGEEHEFVLVVDEATAAEMPQLPHAVTQAVRLGRRPIEAASADGWRSPFDIYRLGRQALRCKPDVFLFPTVYSYYPIPGRIPTVVTFHDAMTEKHPELFFPNRRAQYFWQLKTRAARRRAAAIVTPSKKARADVAAAMNIPIEQIHTVQEAASSHFRLCADTERLGRILERHSLPANRPLLLYVGGISPHKNLVGLLNSLSGIDQEKSPWHLAIVGEHQQDSYLGCYQQVLDLRAKLGLGDQVSFTGFVPDSDLVALYNGATALVLPSLDEGFGLPVIEAMACGLPVAATNRGSVPEVLGDAGLTFDPEDPQSMRHAISRLLTDTELRRKLKAKGLARAAGFSWSKAADEMMTILCGCVIK